MVMKIKVEYTINNCTNCPFYGSKEVSFCRQSTEADDGTTVWKEITYKDLPIPEWCPIKGKKVVKYKW